MFLEDVGLLHNFQVLVIEDKVLMLDAWLVAGGSRAKEVGWREGGRGVLAKSYRKQLVALQRLQI